MTDLQEGESEEVVDFIDETNAIEADQASDDDVTPQKNIDEGNVANLDSYLVSPGQRPNHIFRYYAVRVGYARASYFLEDKDGLEVQREIRVENNTAPMVKIRSAIFLYWDDVYQFLDKIDDLHQDSSLVFKAEYNGFHTFAEAEVSNMLSDLGQFHS